MTLHNSPGVMDTNHLLSHYELLRAGEKFYVQEDPDKQNILLEPCGFLIEFPLTLRFQCAKETNEILLALGYGLMRRIFGFILLFAHMNFSMFMPQVNEVDGIDASGLQKDDINSLLEYVDQVVFENPDLTPEDEDDDNGQNFHLIGIEYFFEPFPELVEHHLAQINFQKFYEIVPCRISAVALQILTPPPRT